MSGLARQRAGDGQHIGRRTRCKCRKIEAELGSCSPRRMTGMGIDQSGAARLASGMLIDGYGPPAHDGVACKALTKADLIEEVARVTELPLKEAAVIVERILASMVHAIEGGDKVE